MVSRGARLDGEMDRQDERVGRRSGENRVVDCDSIRKATVEAIKAAAAEAFQTAEKDALFGFALCTDDDVETLYHVFATREWVAGRAADYPEIGFLSVEWTQSSGDQLFLPLSARLRELATSDNRAGLDPDVGRAGRFQALVEAMSVCRSEGLFDARTLLSVGSTDPDPLMIKLSCDAARDLNTEEIAAAYRRVIDC